MATQIRRCVKWSFVSTEYTVGWGALRDPCILIWRDENGVPFRVPPGEWV